MPGTRCSRKRADGGEAEHDQWKARSGREDEDPDQCADHSYERGPLQLEGIAAALGSRNQDRDDRADGYRSREEASHTRRVHQFAQRVDSHQRLRNDRGRW